MRYDPSDGGERSEDRLAAILSPVMTNSFEIDRTDDDRGTLLIVKPSKADLPYILGKGGEMARAIRTVMRVWAFRNGQHVGIRITEPDGQETSPA